MSDSRDEPERRAWRTDAEWSRLRGRIDTAGAETRLESPRWRRAAGWAAAAALVVVAIGVAARVAARPATESRLVTTAAGERILIRLADSSTVTLGPSSTMRYRLAKDRREMTLDGLADFKVTHDAARPFVVHARNAVMTDLGTEFVVRAYPSDAHIEVAVASGAVAVAGSASRMELHSGDIGVVERDGAVARSAATDVAARRAWVAGQLVFDNATLADVAVELSRWFDVDIRVDDDALAERRVTAVYNSPSLNGVLDALQATTEARVERVGCTITLTRRGR